MIGRAAIGNPWIFAGLDREQVSLAAKAALMRRHLALNLDFYGPQTGLLLFRKHSSKYILGLPEGEALRIPILTCNTVAEFDELLAAALGERVPTALPAPAALVPA
jgi:tRNA-dihydrouridine synthase